MVTGKRIYEIDFFRGLALFMIVIDHIPGSSLGLFTLRNFAFCDATEMFVFISGLAATIAFSRTQERKGAAEARQRMYRRSLKIYLSYVAMSLGLVILGLILTFYGHPSNALGGTFVADATADFAGYTLAILVMATQPPLADILPLYVILIASAPFIVNAMKKSPVPVLAISAAIWWVAHDLNTMIPHQGMHGFLFNPFAWQLMFVCGVLFGVHGSAILAVLDKHAGKVTWAAGIYAAIAAVLALSWKMPEVSAIFPPKKWAEMIYPISKDDLSILRFLSFFSVAWLTRLTVARMTVDWQHGAASAVTMIGRNGLPVFCLGAFISTGADIMTRNLDFPGQDLIVAAIAFALLLAIAWVSDQPLSSRKTFARLQLRFASREG